ncbi:RICIN domain-containing protein [Streptomyces wedmorensis]|uniref:RICIN domain-containing protein n=1 Tax=Streptomyces wedmorensis TaxID=43759 RepID=UPI003446F57B
MSPPCPPWSRRTVPCPSRRCPWDEAGRQGPGTASVDRDEPSRDGTRGGLALPVRVVVSLRPRSPATPERPVGNGYYQIIAKHSGQCLDVAGYSYAHGAPIVQATCGDGHNQQWRLVPYSDGRKFRIQARHSGMCLDVAWGSRQHAAPAMQAFPASGNGNVGLNQQWRFQLKS